MPTAAERDARQLLLHRHKLVRVRTQVKNQLQALALNQGVQRKRKLWSEAGRKQLESLPLLPWASRRRAELLQLLDQLEASIGELDRAVAEQAHARAAAQRLMTHPGVGPVTALARILRRSKADARIVHDSVAGKSAALVASRSGPICDHIGSAMRLVSCVLPDSLCVG